MTDNTDRPEQITLRAHGVPDEQRPVTAPSCGDLLISEAFELPDQFVMATLPLLAKVDVDPDCGRHP